VITLSGGDAGGLEVDWPADAETLAVGSHEYRRISDSQAVFIGVVAEG